MNWPLTAVFWGLNRYVENNDDFSSRLRRFLGRAFTVGVAFRWALRAHRGYTRCIQGYFWRFQPLAGWVRTKLVGLEPIKHLALIAGVGLLDMIAMLTSCAGIWLEVLN